MSFEFLAPDAAVPFNGDRPAAQSPIEHLHREAGARFEARDGWRVVAGYAAPEQEEAVCRDSVGLADASQLGKLDLQGDPAAVASIVAKLAGGAELEPGLAAYREGVWWCPMSASRLVTISPPAATPRLREELEAAAGAAGSFMSLNELTTAFGSNLVAGPLARETFARSTALDMRDERFPELGFAPVSVARTPGLILRDRGDLFVHLFGTGFAEYVWTVFLDAAESLGGRAVGFDAIAPKLGSGVRAGA
jgi:glycine cleavage system aminomethyltransferase T